MRKIHRMSIELIIETDEDIDKTKIINKIHNSLKDQEFIKTTVSGYSCYEYNSNNEKYKDVK